MKRQSMSVKRALHIAIDLIIVLGAAFGILVYGGIYAFTFYYPIFKTFTCLSNLYVFLYYVPALIRLLRGHEDAFCPTWYISVIVSIFQTGFVAALFSMKAPEGSASYIVSAVFYLHVVVPLCVVLEWMFFSERGIFHYWHLAIGPLPLILYGCVAMFGPHFGISLGSGNDVYPYSFMDVAKNGLDYVVKILAAAVVEILVVTLIIIVADHLLAKRKEPSNVAGE